MFDSHVVGCKRNDNQACSSGESDFIDQNQPKFSVKSASYDMVQLPEGATCADVPRRAANVMAARYSSIIVVAAALCLSGAAATTTLFSESQGIEVIVDDMGVPHVYAASDRDLFYGYGYQLASDRMLQLEMWRRFARGRRSEILGGNFKGLLRRHDSAGRRAGAFVRLAALGRRRRRPDAREPAGALGAGAGLARRHQPPRRGNPFRRGAAPVRLRSRRARLPAGGLTEDDPFIVQKMIQLGLDQSLLFEILVTLLDEVAPQTLSSIEMFEPAFPAWAVAPEDMPPDALPKAESRIPPPTKTPHALPAWAKDPALWKKMIAAPKAGSNNWAVSGRFTDNGKPLLAGDPHLVFTLMGAMYAVHLNSKARGGSFDVEGFAFAPAPGLFAGHTQGAAWAPTSAFGDVMDLWAVELGPDGAKLGDQVVPTTSREEIIKVRDGSDQVITITDVPGYGVIFDPSFAGVPVPLTADGRGVLLGWTGFKARSSLYFLELNRAESVDEFDAAVQRIPEMSYNWLGADANDIAYRVSLEVPKRQPIAETREPWRVMDGNDPKAFWPGGNLGPDQLPHGRAAARGWLATANNDPFGFTADGDPTNDAWYYGAFFDPGYRAERIHEELGRLTQRGNVSLEDMQALQTDSRCRMSDSFLELLDQAWANVGKDPALAEFDGRPELGKLVQVLQAWDRRMVRDSQGALAFHAFAHFATQRALEDDLIPLLYERVLEAAPFYVLKVADLALSGRYPRGEDVLQEGRDRIVLLALSDTAKLLVDRFGSVDAGYRWGDMHVTNFDNAYGLGIPLQTVPSDGGENTINVAHSVFRHDFEIPDKWISDYGPVERMVSRFDDDGTPEMWVNFPLGNVADRDSPHFDDMLDDWVEGRYRKMAFSRSEVEDRAEQRIVLERP
ncbi:MAG: penicillin acylase family protein [Polyangiaceae bacterium]